MTSKGAVDVPQVVVGVVGVVPGHVFGGLGAPGGVPQHHATGQGHFGRLRPGDGLRRTQLPAEAALMARILVKVSASPLHDHSP